MNARVLVSVVCPQCEFNLNWIHKGSEYPVPDCFVAPLTAICDSCGEKITLTPDAVHDAQA